MCSPKENQAMQLDRVLENFPSVKALMDKYNNDAKRSGSEELLFSDQGKYEMHRLTYRSILGHPHNASKLKLDGQ